MATPDEMPDYVLTLPSIELTEDAVVSPETGSFADPDLGVPGLQDQPDGLFYHSFGIDVRYHTDTGLRYAPRAGAKGASSVAFWRAHSGITRLFVIWQAVAWGGKPRVPSPDTLCPNDVLVDHVVSVPVRGYLPSGEAVVTVAGAYTYVLQKMLAPGDEMAGSTLPIVNVPAAINRIRVADFDKTLIASIAPAGFSGTAIDY